MTHRIFNVYSGHPVSGNEEEKVYVVAIGVTDDGYETELGPMLVSESLGESLKKLFKPSDTQEIRDPHKRETATKPRWAQVKDIVIRLQRMNKKTWFLSVNR
jgi:hypothetical protein